MPNPRRTPAPWRARLLRHAAPALAMGLSLLGSLILFGGPARSAVAVGGGLGLIALALALVLGGAHLAMRAEFARAFRTDLAPAGGLRGDA